MTNAKTQAAIQIMRKRWLTTLDAINAVGLSSLSQRISVLRRKGYEFDQQVFVTATGSRVAAYKLRKAPGAKS